jgi:large subunit ribosomal protein L9
MQIILLEKIANVGDLGDVVKVREGYARNYLIPQGKAKRATPENLKAIEAKRSELENAASERLAAARALAERLEGMAIQVTQKAGVDGRLFGSVTNIDIVDALKSQGVEIERSMIRMSAGPLKQIGEYPLTVALHTDVVAHINVSVRGDTAVG